MSVESYDMLKRDKNIARSVSEVCKYSWITIYVHIVGVERHTVSFLDGRDQ
jgi:hypothetical protein